MNIYVGNLPFNVGQEHLEALFGQYGTVHSAAVILDRETGRSRGFGFVEMSDSDGQQAIAALNGHQLDGRTLTVNEAKPREPRQGGGGGGGGRPQRDRRDRW